MIKRIGVVPTRRLCRLGAGLPAGVRNPLRIGRHNPVGRADASCRPVRRCGPVPEARTTVATDRITSGFPVYTGEFESTVVASALKCADPGPARQPATDRLSAVVNGSWLCRPADTDP